MCCSSYIVHEGLRVRSQAGTKLSMVAHSILSTLRVRDEQRPHTLQGSKLFVSHSTPAYMTAWSVHESRSVLVIVHPVMTGCRAHTQLIPQHNAYMRYRCHSSRKKSVASNQAQHCWELPPKTLFVAYFQSLGASLALSESVSC